MNVILGLLDTEDEDLNIQRHW